MPATAPLRFSANLGFLWPDRPLLQRIEAAAKAGFRAIEMHWPYDVPAQDLAQLCQRLNLTVLGINTVRGDVAKGENGLGALAGREAEFQAAMDQSIAYAVAIGGTSVHAMAGFVPKEQLGTARQVFLKNLELATQKAEKAGLTVLLEPLNPRDAPGYFYHRVEDAVSLIDEIGAPNLKLMFDCYHVGVTQGDILTRLNRHFDKIGHVQIAAVPSRAEPDEGEIAYGAIFAELTRLGWPGWVGAEYKPRGDTDAGLGWVKTLGVSL